MKIVVIFDSIVRPDTTGTHFLPALRAIGHDVFHFEPLRSKGGQLGFIGYDECPRDANLYLAIDDDLAYPGPIDMGPSAYVCIDTHRLDVPLVGGTMLRYEKAQGFGHVFSAQRDGVNLLAARGVRATWLPLAYDPAVWYPDSNKEKEIDWCFIGNMTSERDGICRTLAREFPNCIFGSSYGSARLGVLQRSRIILNLPIGNDVNMRFFEAAGVGGLMLTGLTGNGDEALLPGVVGFRRPEELRFLVAQHLLDEHARFALAVEHQRYVHANHTFAHRVTDVLRDCGLAETPRTVL